MFKITKNEMLLAIILAAGGYIFSSRNFILWLNQFNPFQGFVIYYAILYTAMYGLSKFGLIIYKFRIDTSTKILGLLLITFAFFLIVDWESCYINQIVTGSCANVSNIYFGSEDGVTYWFWSTYMGIANVEYAGLLTYVFTPFVLTLLGAMLVSGGIRLF